ncbi:MAG: ATP-binding protein, partial [Planctomycetota bacterium]|nr:ATP-binding protein [Planctomycetota bacterium]
NEVFCFDHQVLKLNLYGIRQVSIKQHVLSRWSEVFHDATAAAAVIDRIVRHAQVFKMDGESYRLREAKSRGQGKKRTKK